MPGVDKRINFNAFHILLIVLISNIIMNHSCAIESIVNGMYYVLNMEPLSFWFLMAHVFIVYIMLTSIEIDINFRADIKLNL